MNRAWLLAACVCLILAGCQRYVPTFSIFSVQGSLKFGEDTLGELEQGALYNVWVPKKALVRLLAEGADATQTAIARELMALPDGIARSREDYNVGVGLDANIHEYGVALVQSGDYKKASALLTWSKKLTAKGRELRARGFDPSFTYPVCDDKFRWRANEPVMRCKDCAPYCPMAGWGGLESFQNYVLWQEFFEADLEGRLRLAQGQPRSAVPAFQRAVDALEKLRDGWEGFRAGPLREFDQIEHRKGSYGVRYRSEMLALNEGFDASTMKLLKTSSHANAILAQAFLAAGDPQSAVALGRKATALMDQRRTNWESYARVLVSSGRYMDVAFSQSDFKEGCSELSNMNNASEPLRGPEYFDAWIQRVYTQHGWWLDVQGMTARELEALIEAGELDEAQRKASEIEQYTSRRAGWCRKGFVGDRIHGMEDVRPAVTLAHWAQARVALLRGDLATAQQHASELALRRLDGAGMSSTPDDTDPVWIHVHELRGDIAFAGKDYPGALAAYRDGIRFLELRRATTSDLYSTMNFGAMFARVYDGAIRAALAMNDTTAAYDQLQQWKGRTFLELLSRSGAAGVRSEKALSTAEIRVALPQDTALLDYYVGAQGTLVFVVTREGIRAVTLSDPDPAGYAQRLRDAIETELTSLADGKIVNPILAEGYGRYAAPLGETLRTHPKLIVVPSGPLHYLPFHALLDGAGQYLIERNRLSYLPTASVLPAALSKKARAGGSMLVIGDPANTGLPPLPAARREAEELGKLVPGASVLVGTAATEKAFKASFARHSQIDLAMHGVMDVEDPLNSALRMTPGDGEDGELTAAEILGLRNEVDLVLLSACGTALLAEVGDERAPGAGGRSRPNGDDLFGLTRAFLLSGSATVVATLWPVADDPTTVFARGFIERHGKGQGKADAARDAQLAMFETRLSVTGDPAARGLHRKRPAAGEQPAPSSMGLRNPAYWAPFVVIGAP